MLINDVAIITARAGSKRIPKKNIKIFFNKPMIAYAIDACLSSGVFSEVMVSTDSEEIAEISRKYGAKVPFLRSPKTSDDFATTYDVLEEVVLEYKKNKTEILNICCVYPCVPFLNGKILKDAYDSFINSKLDALVPVVKFTYPIQRAFKIENNFLKYLYPEYEKARSQDLEPRFHDVGMFYYIKTEALLREKKVVCPKTTFLELPEKYVQDIDNESDWEMAEMKYRIINNV